MVTDIVALFAFNAATIILIYLGAGMHMGATHGILASVIAQNSPKELIGTSFAIYYGIDGVCIFFSNFLAGLSSSTALFLGLDGSAGPFLQGILACLLASIYILSLLQRDRKEAKNVA
jgi:MFS-type transporter involved in bile tolerance (Atg22 family)